MTVYSLEELDHRWEKQKESILIANLVVAVSAFDMLFLHHTPEKIAWLPSRTVTTTTFLLFQIVGYFLFCFRTFKQTFLTGIRWAISMGISITAFLTTLFLFALYYTYSGVQDSAGKVYYDSATCFYFAVETWTTIGYGDLVPTLASRPFVIIEALLSYVFTGVFLALLIHTTNILYALRHSKQP
jgi:hypothetical protein